MVGVIKGYILSISDQHRVLFNIYRYTSFENNLENYELRAVCHRDA